VITPISADEFMASAPTSLAGSSPWASRYAAEIRRVVLEHAARAPRTLQQHLGPSELGVACDRQVAGKMAALPSTNHVVDPWASIVGTALHAWEAEAFDADNLRSGVLRWVTEQKVTPHPDHPGTADLYDALEQAVVDHKNLGPSSLDKIRKGGTSAVTGKPIIGPRHYRAQLFMYGLGYVLLGLPVRKVAIAAYPRTASTLDGLYVRDEDFTSDGFTLLDEPAALLTEVFNDTARRKAQAQTLLAGAPLSDIPSDPDDSTCVWCPFFRPEAARKPELLATSCPGARKTTY
jgi:hypothetical protein